jgi:hypothetical protein
MQTREVIAQHNTEISTQLTEQPAWQALAAHSSSVSRTHLRQLFAADTLRGERYTAAAESIFLDYSTNCITDETLRLLMQLTRECGLGEAIAAIFRGNAINVTEKRAVLHTALRAPDKSIKWAFGPTFAPTTATRRIAVVRGSEPQRRLRPSTGRRR